MQMCTYIGYTQHVHTRTLVLGKHMIDHAHAVQLSSRAAVSPAAGKAQRSPGSALEINPAGSFHKPQC